MNEKGVIFQSYIVSVNPCYEIFREIFQSKGIIFQSCTVCERKRCNFSITHSLWILHNYAAFWHKSRFDNIGIEEDCDIPVWSTKRHQNHKMCRQPRTLHSSILPVCLTPSWRHDFLDAHKGFGPRPQVALGVSTGGVDRGRRRLDRLVGCLHK